MFFDGTQGELYKKLGDIDSFQGNLFSDLPKIRERRVNDNTFDSVQHLGDFGHYSQSTQICLIRVISELASKLGEFSDEQEYSNSSHATTPQDELFYPLIDV